MGIGFNSKDKEVEEEKPLLYRTVIECPICEEDVSNRFKGKCSCENLTIDQIKSITDVRHHPNANWTHFKTVTYTKEPPRIYDVLLADELP
mgnify:CR=1 FL=1